MGAKIIDLFLGDHHLLSIDGGRGAPVGYMFQMKEKKKRKFDILLCFLPVFYAVMMRLRWQTNRLKDNKKNDDCSAKQRSSCFIDAINHDYHLH